MGWSCNRDAHEVLDVWAQACRATTGSSNLYKVGAQDYFYEVSRREHSDGAITGTVHKCLPNNMCLKGGSFRIEGNGQVKRYPVGMKKLLASLGLRDVPAKRCLACDATEHDTGSVLCHVRRQQLWAQGIDE